MAGTEERALGIGELAEAAGVSVKTARFYSDSGLLPEAERSTGGHRRYGPEAVERLRTVRRLRALGLALPVVTDVVHGEVGVAEALARHRAEVEARLTELRWREAALSAIAEEPAALEAFGDALYSQPSTDSFAAFWRRVLPLRLPLPLMAAILDRAVPDLPGAPTPAQALAYARLHALTSDREVAAEIRRTGGIDCDNAELLYEGVGEAYDLTIRQSPDALACFVAAHAQSRHAEDTAAFRRKLARGLVMADPRMADYWTLAAELRADGQPDMGTAHARLTAELLSEVGQSIGIGHPGGACGATGSGACLRAEVHVTRSARENAPAG